MDGYNRDGYDHTPVATTPPHTWDTCSHVAQPTVYNRERREATIDDPLHDEWDDTATTRSIMGIHRELEPHQEDD